MKNTPPAPQGPFSVQDVVYALFKYKWSILAFALLGLIAAGVYYKINPQNYESRAKLLVRYVVERNAVDTVDSQNGASDGVIAAETQIITSWDTAMKTAEAVGAKRLVPGDAAADTSAASGVIAGGLTVAAVSNVINVSFSDDDPAVARDVLTRLLNVYLEQHIKIHRSGESFDFVSQQTDQVRSRLKQAEEDLAKMKSQTGVVSVAGTTDGLSDQIALTQREILDTEAAVSEQTARVKEVSGGATAPSSEDKTPEPAQVDGATVFRYQGMQNYLSQARQKLFAMEARYTPDNPLVKQAATEVAQFEKSIRTMEASHPGLLATASSSEGTRGVDPMIERAGLAAAKARLATLKSQLAVLKKQSVDFSDVGLKIDQLERRRDIDATNLKTFESSLEKARLDEQLDPSRIPNISIVQSPSPAFPVPGYKPKILLGLAASGLAIGLVLAVLRGVVLDRTVKRPGELEARLGVSHVVTIPVLSAKPRQKAIGNGQAKSLMDKKANGVASEVAPWDPRHFLSNYGDVLRDRLIHIFELENMTHKPKMVGVTGCSRGAGASSIASSLAAAMSKTGDGKVLLVDVNTKRPAVQRFVNGDPVGWVADVLESGGQPDAKAPDADNLYVATVEHVNSETEPFNPRTLYKMIPKFRASEFDYIIFDLPPIEQMSPTLPMAGFMDKVVLVVEAEKSTKEHMKRTLEELAFAKASVVGVVNKVKPRLPGWADM